MARILISEPNRHLQRLLQQMVLRLGHEPVLARVPSPRDLTGADVFLVEPAAPLGAVLAQAASIAEPTLPILCASVTAPPPELAALGVVFAASVVKPFSLAQLDEAIATALSVRHGVEDQSA